MNTVLLVELAVAVGVLEDQNLVAVLALVLGQERPGRRVASRVDVGLDDPQPAAVVDAERDRLVHVRLAGEERDLEARRARSSPCAASSGVSPAYLYDVGRRRRLGLRPLRRTFGFCGVEPEVVEVDVPPVRRCACRRCE